MTTTQSSDVTTKRLTTMDSSEFKEEESAFKKPRIEEEGDDGTKEEEEEEEEEESDDMEYEPKLDADGKKIPNFPNAIESEVEWGVDSYDGHEFESDPEIRASVGDEAYLEFRNNRIEALKHRGFEPDLVKYIYPVLDLDEPEGPGERTNREYLTKLVNLCVQKLKDEKGKTVELVRVVKGTWTVGSWWKVYITFMAREYPGGPEIEYQAKAKDYVGGGSRPPVPILCRPAPVI